MGPVPNSTMRLNHYIAKTGFASRRAADKLIASGEVFVDGCKILEPFFQVKDNNQVKVSGKVLKLKQQIYLLFNKPKGVTTTLKDRHAEETITDFIPKGYQGVYPVGRLDKNSSGLLILTNDGDFCYRLTHPKFMVEKEYLVELAGFLEAGAIAAAKRGVKDEGELLNVKSIKIFKLGRQTTLCQAIITEGKKRHLRRLFKQLGYPVKELKRVRVGKFTLGNLKPGQYRLIRDTSHLKS